MILLLVLFLPRIVYHDSMQLQTYTNMHTVLEPLASPVPPFMGVMVGAQPKKGWNGHQHLRPSPPGPLVGSL